MCFPKKRVRIWAGRMRRARRQRSACGKLNFSSAGEGGERRRLKKEPPSRMVNLTITDKSAIEIVIPVIAETLENKKNQEGNGSPEKGVAQRLPRRTRFHAMCPIQ